MTDDGKGVDPNANADDPNADVVVDDPKAGVEDPKPVKDEPVIEKAKKGEKFNLDSVLDGGSFTKEQKDQIRKMAQQVGDQRAGEAAATAREKVKAEADAAEVKALEAEGKYEQALAKIKATSEASALLVETTSMLTEVNALEFASLFQMDLATLEGRKEFTAAVEDIVNARVDAKVRAGLKSDPPDPQKKKEKQIDAPPPGQFEYGNSMDRFKR